LLLSKLSVARCFLFGFGLSAEARSTRSLVRAEILDFSPKILTLYLQCGKPGRFESAEPKSSFVPLLPVSCKLASRRAIDLWFVLEVLPAFNLQVLTRYLEISKAHVLAISSDSAIFESDRHVCVPTAIVQKTSESSLLYRICSLLASSLSVRLELPHHTSREAPDYRIRC
jgi:hypothetical protein